MKQSKTKYLQTLQQNIEETKFLLSTYKLDKSLTALTRILQQRILLIILPCFYEIRRVGNDRILRGEPVEKISIIFQIFQRRDQRQICYCFMKIKLCLVNFNMLTFKKGKRRVLIGNIGNDERNQRKQSRGKKRRNIEREIERVECKINGIQEAYREFLQNIRVEKY